MSKAKDLTNMRFGKLIVLRRVDNTKSGKAQWLCRCDCGNETTVVSNKLISGKTITNIIYADALVDKKNMLHIMLLCQGKVKAVDV